MSRLDDLLASIDGNDLMNEMLKDVERDKRSRMDRCIHCGINLAKVQPLFIVTEWHDKKLTGRRWCSIQCRDYWMRSQDMRQRRPGQAEGTESQAVSVERAEDSERAVSPERTVQLERAADDERTVTIKRADKERTDDKERGM